MPIVESTKVVLDSASTWLTLPGGAAKIEAHVV
jgi:hypothetical protein